MTSPYNFVVNYNKDDPNLLSQLCDFHGSDKGWVKSPKTLWPWYAHTFTDYVSRLFDHCRPHVLRVYENGIGTNTTTMQSSMGANGRPGASLRVWRDYFPNARIYGSDIDQNILFEEHRIKTYFVDQRNPNAIQSMWQKIGEHDFDLMIDDGLHAFDAGRTLFENSISKIASTGIYIIEDVMPGDQTNYMRYFEKTDYRVDFVNLNRPYAPLENNSLVVVRKR